MFDDSMRDLLGFQARTLYEEYTPSNNPVDVLSFDNVFIETDIAKRKIFKGKRTGIIHNFTMVLWMLILVTNTLRNFEVECYII